MGVKYDKEHRIADFRTGAIDIMELFQAAEILTGRNSARRYHPRVADGMYQWWMRQPLKEQTFPPDGESDQSLIRLP